MNPWKRLSARLDAICASIGADPRKADLSPEQREAIWAAQPKPEGWHRRPCCYRETDMLDHCAYRAEFVMDTRPSKSWPFYADFEDEADADLFIIRFGWSGEYPYGRKS